VKTSKARIDSDLIKQIKKLTNIDHEVNPWEKRVILYVDKRMDSLNREQQEILQQIRSMGVTVVNSLEELRQVL